MRLITEENKQMEVRRRMPEVMKIRDDELRAKTVDMIANAPEYFWYVPASSSKKYHNPYCRMEHGLWMHVKMAFSALERFQGTYKQMGLLDDQWIDYARAAILCHDLYKQGYPEERSELRPSERHTVSDHDEIARNYAEFEHDMPEPVCTAIYDHNGGWYDGGAPVDHDARSRQFHLSMLVHTADMAASSPDGTWGLYQPARELAEKYPNVPRSALK